MNELISYLNGVDGGSLEKLKETFCISVTPHPTLPLMILSYDQLDSKPKWHPLVRACRGTVVELLPDGTYKIAAPAVTRFFNHNEGGKEIDPFDWTDFTVQEKVDGSLITLFNYKGAWLCKTRASWAQSEIYRGGPTWEQAILESLHINNLQELNNDYSQDLTIVGELCSTYNKVVQFHAKPKFYLITIFDKEKELCSRDLKDFYYWGCVKNNIKYIPNYQFKSIEEAEEKLLKISKESPTFEGFVFRDSYNNRMKLKSLTYVALHAMRGESGNMDMLKYLVPVCIDGNIEETCIYFPEYRDNLEKTNKLLKEEFAKLELVWGGAVLNGTQKDFAVSINGKSKFTGMLFTKKKTGEPIADIWKRSAATIAAYLEKSI